MFVNFILSFFTLLVCCGCANTQRIDRKAPSRIDIYRSYPSVLRHSPSASVRKSELVTRFYRSVQSGEKVRYTWFGGSPSEYWYVIVDEDGSQMMLLKQFDFSMPFVLLPFRLEAKTPEILLPRRVGIRVPEAFIDEVLKVSRISLSQ